MSGSDPNWTEELRSRYRAIEQEVRDFVPWFLPEYEPLRKLGKAKLDLPGHVSRFQQGCGDLRPFGTQTQRPGCTI